MPIIAAILGVVGNFFTGLFNFKGEQAKTVQSTIDLLTSINETDGQAVTATAQALQSILTQGSFLERNWRPVLMCLLMTIIGCWFFGYVPPHFNDNVSPMMDKVLNLLTIGVGGYIPCRTIEKIMTQINIGAILKALINKKVS